MKPPPLSSRRRGCVLLANLLIITTVLTSSYVAVSPVQQGPAPTLVIEAPTQVADVQVGQTTNVSFAAPGSWDWSSSPGTSASVDITGEGLVAYADAMEGAFEWKLGREQSQPCEAANDLNRDVNGDGCIDVVDIQLVLANS